MKQTDLLQQSIEERRSEEVTHIVERMPVTFGWVVAGIVFFLASLVIVFGWLIKYPEILTGQITISAKKADSRVVANSTGNLKLFQYKNRDTIRAGDYIGMIENGAQISDVTQLDSILYKIDIGNISYKNHRNLFPKNLLIGELTAKYYSFLNALYQFLDYSVTQPFQNKIQIGKQLVSTQKKIKQDVLLQYEILKRKMETARSLHSRDSVLLKKGILSKADFEKSSLNRIAAEREYEGIRKDINSSDYQIEEAESKIQDIDIQKIEKERELQVVLFNSFHELREGIVEWKRKYAFIAPVDGVLEFSGFLKNSDFIKAGEEIFSIIPPVNEAVGEMFLPEQGAGRVMAGQDVIIKLDNYPFQEYGTLRGKVKSISLVTNKRVFTNVSAKNDYKESETIISGYLATIILPSGMKTNYGAELDFHFGAKGSGEIITADKRLINRLFDNLKYRLKQ